jgi:hypothetical protein
VSFAVQESKKAKATAQPIVRGKLWIQVSFVKRDERTSECATVEERPFEGRVKRIEK